jgi:hypothetical protein
MAKNSPIQLTEGFHEIDTIKVMLAEKSLKEFVQQAWYIIEPRISLKWGWHLDAICEHLQAVSHNEINRLIINVPPRSGKPVSENSRVLMADGSYKLIKDVKVGDKVISHLGRPCKVSGVHPQGKLDVLQIRTRTHREVIPAYDHPFLTPEGWVNAGDLEVGDNLILVSSHESPFSCQTTDDIVEIKKLSNPVNCYCLTVDNDHTFTVNDIAVHNSSIVSVLWPVWEWVTTPSSRWLFTSYAQDLSVRDSVKSRRLIQNEWFQERWGDRFYLVDDTNQKTRYLNNWGGYRVSSSVKGLGTGEGGDRLVCLPYSTYISTSEGLVQIGDIVENQINVKVHSFNHETNTIELNSIQEFQKNPPKDYIQIELEDGSTLTLTEDHEVFTVNRGYVRADELGLEDEVLTL